MSDCGLAKFAWFVALSASARNCNLMRSDKLITTHPQPQTRNELQAWFVAEHVVKMSLTHAK